MERELLDMMSQSFISGYKQHCCIRDILFPQAYVNGLSLADKTWANEEVRQWPKLADEWIKI